MPTEITERFRSVVSSNWLTLLIASEMQISACLPTTQRSLRPTRIARQSIRNLGACGQDSKNGPADRMVGRLWLSFMPRLEVNRPQITFLCRLQRTVLLVQEIGSGLPQCSKGGHVKVASLLAKLTEKPIMRCTEISSCAVLLASAAMNTMPWLPNRTVFAPSARSQKQPFVRVRFCRSVWITTIGLARTAGWCNIGIGSLAESPERLRAAIAYLDRWNAIETAPLPDNVVKLKS
jgi:hypothetical protein